MIVFRKIILTMVVVFLFSGHNLVQASVVINEVQLYPTTERFLELYNTGTSIVNLTDWYIQRKTATGNSFNSLVSKPNFENKTINPGSYFVISKNFLSSSDVILSTLTLTESNTIQIKNSDGEVVDLIGWGDASICNGACASNPPEGQSIQKTTNGWVVDTPTPGAINEDNDVISPPPDANENIDSGSGTNGGSESSTSTKVIEQPKTRIEIVAKELAFAGFPVYFQVTSYKNNGGRLLYGKYFWNFGDGDFKEMKASKVGKFSHTYFYPGIYDVSLEYYVNYYTEKPEAVDEMVIRVISPDIVISNVGNEKDFFIELTNNTNYNADISKWILVSDRINFTFPKNTILRSKKKIIISPYITNFSIGDKNTLKLMTPQRKVVYDYSSSFVISNKVSNKNILHSDIAIKQTSSVLQTLEGISDENLEASSILSETKEDNDNFYISIFILLIFLSITSSAVYFIRRKKTSIIAGDDFELIDE